MAEWFAGKGIVHAFGIIGGGNVVLFDAIAKLGATQIVCCHHEQAAVMAASYYYRTCGKMAAALVTIGAGSSNAVTGVIAAWMDSVPVLVISGNESTKDIGTKTRVWGVQGYGSVELVKDVTKLAVRPPLNLIVPTLEAAYEVALAPKQGPVWIDIPKDKAGMEI